MTNSLSVPTFYFFPPELMNRSVERFFFMDHSSGYDHRKTLLMVMIHIV